MMGLNANASRARVVAAQVVDQVIHEGRLLDMALEHALAHAPQELNAALVQEMAYGTLRWAQQLAAIAARLLERPLRTKDRDIQALLLIGLYQLSYMRLQPHAAVSETVAAAEQLGKSWSKGMLNACLRRFLREREPILREINGDAALASSHPRWLLDAICADWPGHWRSIIDANNQRPPMTLRVNLRKNSRESYLARLRREDVPARAIKEIDCAVVLERPVPVSALPGFDAGCVSVQDAAAQLATLLLDLAPGQRVLDACAAPGGKLGHILERCPGLARIIALDREPARLPLIKANLARLQLNAEVTLGDAARPASWWDGKRFDRILLDAPCTATGVIRRHPDIKVHRSVDDLRRLIDLQASILAGLWPLLASSGKLLYVTCSVLAPENDVQIRRFARLHDDVRIVPLLLSLGIAKTAGIQILPGQADMDGFYYACLQKT